MTDQNDIDLPLSGIRVLDFSQFLAGPACATRLADLGAHVTKIERPNGGDACRSLATADQWVRDDSLLFHAINRGKDSQTADLKDAGDLAAVKALIADADVMIHNFRPGVMERIGLGYADVKAINPSLIYGVVSGYGTEGPWKDKPGQDLLVQARSGLLWLSGSADNDPIPMGVSVADIVTGMHLTQGILAALIRKFRSGAGSLVEVSLLASTMDLQFEQFTAYLNSDGNLPTRSVVNGANVNATAPYGVYRTADGFIVIAMAELAALEKLLELSALAPFKDGSRSFTARDEIKTILRDALVKKSSAHWLDRLEPAGIWCAEVLNWKTLSETGALDALDVVQDVMASGGRSVKTTICPIRMDGQVLRGHRAAPTLGAQGHVTSKGKAEAV